MWYSRIGSELSISGRNLARRWLRPMLYADWVNLHSGGHRFQGTLRDGRSSCGRGKELDKCHSCVRLFSPCGDAGREHGDLLDLSGQGTDEIYARDGEEFADLLESDLDFPPRHDRTDRLIANPLSRRFRLK